MQYLNDDTDELYRCAAENYSLNTNHPDWKKIADALRAEGEPVVRQKNRPNLQWLLRLLRLSRRVRKLNELNAAIVNPPTLILRRTRSPIVNGQRPTGHVGFETFW